MRELGPFTAYRALNDHNVSADHFDWVDELPREASREARGGDGPVTAAGAERGGEA